MFRADAVAELARRELERMNAAERADQLETMLFEGCDTDPGWALLSPELRTEFEGQHLLEPASSRRYDDVLLLR